MTLGPVFQLYLCFTDSLQIGHSEEDALRLREASHRSWDGHTLSLAGCSSKPGKKLFSYNSRPERLSVLSKASLKARHSDALPI